MSMSSHVVGFRPPDEKRKKMYEVWKTCSIAGIEPPDEVSEFFDYEDPDVLGVEVDLIKKALVTEWSNNGSRGFEIHVDDIPENITVIRFFNSW